MLKIYNTRHQFLTLLDQEIKDIYTTDTLETGQRTLSFKIACKEQYFQFLDEENYVETDDYSYIIKEINSKDNKFIEVFCSANIEDIKGSVFLVFDCYDKNLQQGYEYCISQSPGWSVNYHSEDHTKITYQEPYINAYDMLRRIAEDYGQELWFDTKNKQVHIYDTMGVEFGAYYSNELHLKQLKVTGHTYDYATVLYPIGKDGLTISNINNGKDYIEDYRYSNKYIQKLFIDDTIEVPELLMQKAQEELDRIAMPQTSYKLYVSSVGDNISIGDNIIIVDDIKKIKQTQRVVKITRYPKAPEKSTLEISNLMSNFFNMYIKGEKRIDRNVKYVRSLIDAME